MITDLVDYLNNHLFLASQGIMDTSFIGLDATPIAANSAVLSNQAKMLIAHIRLLSNPTFESMRFAHLYRIFF